MNLEAALQCPCAVVGAGVRGQRGGRDVAEGSVIRCANALDQLEAIEERHPQTGHKDVRSIRFDDLQRGAP